MKSFVVFILFFCCFTIVRAGNFVVDMKITHIDSIENCGRLLRNHLYVIYGKDKKGKIYKVLSQYEQDKPHGQSLVSKGKKYTIALKSFFLASISKIGNYSSLEIAGSIYADNLVYLERDKGVEDLYVSEDLNGLFLKMHSKEFFKEIISSQQTLLAKEYETRKKMLENIIGKYHLKDSLNDRAFCFYNFANFWTISCLTNANVGILYYTSEDCFMKSQRISNTRQISRVFSLLSDKYENLSRYRVKDYRYADAYFAVFDKSHEKSFEWSSNTHCKKKYFTHINNIIEDFVAICDNYLIFDN